MTVSNQASGQKDRSIIFNRTMYAAFVLLSIYFLMRRDFANAMSNLGIALIFDPFDQKIKWGSRPLYQCAWLFVHVGLVFGMLIYVLVEGINIF